MTNTPALVITYNPGLDLPQKLDTLFHEFDEILLVDNGSSAEIRDIIQAQVKDRGARLKALLNDRNLGIATALNQGFSMAIQMGYEHLITLDQDSTPVAGMKSELIKAEQDHPNRGRLAVLAPDIVEDMLGKPSRYIRPKGFFFFERVTCKGEILRNLGFVITSGSMFNLEHYKRIGPFRDDFFIDAVDTEYCLRARTMGYEISVACKAKLKHNLGKRQRKQFLGKTQSPTFHPPSRWYYISRNRVRMIVLYGWRFPHWLFHEMIITMTSLARMLLFEDRRALKLKAILLGTWHGLNNTLGEMSMETKRRLAIP